MNKYRVVIAIYADQEAVDETDAVHRVMHNLNLPSCDYDPKVVPAVESWGTKHGSPMLDTLLVRTTTLTAYPKG
jgi:hypothetical protein